MEIDELKELLENVGKPKEGWSGTTGVSPLKVQLEAIVDLLGQLKGEYEKEHKEQLLKLDVLMKSKASAAKVRVKKDGV